MSVTRTVFTLMSGVLAATALSAAPAYRGTIPGSAAAFSYGMAVATDGVTVAISSVGNVDFLTYSAATSTWQLVTRVAIKGNPTSLAIYKNIALAKHDKGVIAFDLINSQWVATQDLSMPDIGSTYFGNSIALLSYTAVVGTPHYSGDRGAAYVIRRSTPTGPWVATQGIGSPTPTADNFGGSVALSAISGQHYLLISSPYYGNGAGRVWAYKENTTTLNYDPAGIIPNASGSALARFGESVSAAGSKVLIGAPADNGFLGSARLYSVSMTGGGFSATLTQTITSQVSAQLFGEYVNLQSTSAVISSRSSLAWYPVSLNLLGVASQLFTGPVSGAFGTPVAYTPGLLFAGNPIANGNYGAVLWYQ